MESQNNFGIKEVLWNLAGYKKEIVEQCKVDSFHASIIGSLVLMVGIYACIAWSFFFGTVFHDPLVSIGAGLFMGAFIVAFDRALIASLAGGKPNMLSLGFRLALALMLGIFLSQPMILKFFEPEVKREAQILLDKKVLERKTELENLFAPESKHLNARKNEMLKTIADKKEARDKAEKDFKKEMDGSGGTGKRGYEDISKKKEAILLKHEDEYEETNTKLQKELAAVQTSIDSLQGSITQQVEVFRKENAEFGTLIQAEALHSLIEKDKSHTLRNRYYLLAVILTLIELSALIAKLIFSSRSYSAKVNAYTDEEIKNTETDKEISFENIEKRKRG